jgi:hypothetical protein
MRIENCVNPNYFTVDGRIIHEVSLSLLTERGLLENPEFAETARGEFLREQTYALQGAEALALFSQGEFYHIDDNGGITAGRRFSNAQFTVPDGVRTVRKAGFYGIDCLSAVTFPASVETIEEDAFNSCRNLSSVTFSYGLKHIGPRAFYGTALRGLVLPASVESISPRGVLPRTRGIICVDRGLSLESRRSARRGGWSGKIVSAGDTESSRNHDIVNHITSAACADSAAHTVSRLHSAATRTHGAYHMRCGDGRACNRVRADRRGRGVSVSLCQGVAGLAAKQTNIDLQRGVYRVP